MSKQFTIADLKPLAGYVVVEPAKAEKKTMSGIYLPDDADEKPQYGTVLAVGEKVFQEGKEIVPPVKVKAQVIYKKWGGNEVKVGDTEYQILKFEDILATIG